MCRTAKNVTKITLADSKIPWSDWLDFNQETISKVPESPGVFMMHAAMKILYISDSENIRKRLLESISAPCLSDATRFRYLLSVSHESLKEDLIKDYQRRHDGKLPGCM